MIRANVLGGQSIFHAWTVPALTGHGAGLVDVHAAGVVLEVGVDGEGDGDRAVGHDLGLRARARRMRCEPAPADGTRQAAGEGGGVEEMEGEWELVAGEELELKWLLRALKRRVQR